MAVTAQRESAMVLHLTRRRKPHTGNSAHEPPHIVLRRRPDLERPYKTPEAVTTGITASAPSCVAVVATFPWTRW